MDIDKMISKYIEASINYGNAQREYGQTEIANYLKNIRKEITLPTTPTKDSLIFKYELKAAYLYEQATKKSLNNFDIKNIPIQKR